MYTLPVYKHKYVFYISFNAYSLCIHTLYCTHKSTLGNRWSMLYIPDDPDTRVRAHTYIHIHTHDHSLHVRACIRGPRRHGTENRALLCSYLRSDVSHVVIVYRSVLVHVRCSSDVVVDEHWTHKHHLVLLLQSCLTNDQLLLLSYVTKSVQSIELMLIRLQENLRIRQLRTQQIKSVVAAVNDE